MFVGDPSTARLSSVLFFWRWCILPALKEADILGQKSLSSLFFVSYMTSFTNSLEEVLPGRIFQSCKASKQSRHVTS